MLIMVRSSEITIALKSQNQRTTTEQTQVDRGLIKSLVLEFLLFVPCSVALVLLTVRPWVALSKELQAMKNTDMYIDSLLGAISYGFPFALLRRIVTRIALNTLKEFAAIENQDREAEASSARR